MKQRIFVMFFLMVMFWLTSPLALHATTYYEDIIHTVVFLQIPKQIYERVDNQWQEVWLKNVKTETNTPKRTIETGTGFLVRHSNATYIVTAKHVVIDAAGKASNMGEVWVNTKDGNAHQLKIADMVAFHHGRGWFLHPSADIAILPYSRPMDLAVLALDIPEKCASTNTISMLSPVVAFGFPMGLGVGKVLEPVAKKCEVASSSVSLSADTNAPRYILLDQALAQGYSGSPFYTDVPPAATSHEFRLIGLMSAVSSDISGGKVSYVVPIRTLFELFDSEDFKKYEKELTKPQQDQENK